MKLGLGTVQFGLKYGISNSEGKTSAVEVARILDFAASQGIQVIDTASLYGDSEEVLGHGLNSKNHAFRIVTKTSDSKNIESTFLQSLKKLRQDRLYGLLVHHSKDLLGSEGTVVYEKLLSLKEKGLVEKIGVSVYDEDEINRILVRFPIDLIQLPINIFDQRLIKRGQLSLLKSKGIEIHARSAFLQGLLLMDPNHLPSQFNSIRPLLSGFRQWATSQSMTPAAAALRFVMNIPEVDSVICGVNSLEQFSELCEIAAFSPNPNLNRELSQFMCNDPGILNPSLWSQPS